MVWALLFKGGLGSYLALCLIFVVLRQVMPPWHVRAKTYVGEPNAYGNCPAMLWKLQPVEPREVRPQLRLF
jgi:hypothetical protein